MRKQRKRDLPSIGYFPNGYNSQGANRSNSGARYPSWSPQCEGGAQAPVPSSIAFPGTLAGNGTQKVRTGTRPSTQILDVYPESCHLSLSTLGPEGKLWDKILLQQMLLGTSASFIRMPGLSLGSFSDSILAEEHLGRHQ